MMKKNLARFLLALTCCFALMSLVGCGPAAASSSPESLRYDTKYYRYREMHNNKDGECPYYVFYSDGTCMYRWYEVVNYSGGFVGDMTGVRGVEYITYYKYTFLDEERTGVMCFFDSKKTTYFGKNGSVVREDTKASEADGKQFYIMSVSKNVVSSVSQSGSVGYYINENYVDEIPNFYPEEKK